MARKSQKAKSDFAKVIEESKSTVLKAQEDILKAEEEVRMAEEILRLQEEEETKILNNTEEQIRKIASDKDMFCGVVLTNDDIIKIVDLALGTHENIKIQFKLYYNN